MKLIDRLKHAYTNGITRRHVESARKILEMTNFDDWFERIGEPRYGEEGYKKAIQEIPKPEEILERIVYCIGYYRPPI